jgi:hypothetical protein
MPREVNFGGCTKTATWLPQGQAVSVSISGRVSRTFAREEEPTDRPGRVLDGGANRQAERSFKVTGSNVI